MVDLQPHDDRPHRSESVETVSAPRPGVPEPSAIDAQAEALAKHCTYANRTGAWRLLTQLCSEGAAPDDLLFEVIPTAARKLQVEVSLDLAAGSDGTVAACLLRTLALQLHDRYPPHRFIDRRAIFLEATGSTLDVEALLHVIALERAGWRVEALQGLEVRTALEPVRVAAPDVVLCSANDVGGALRLAWAVRTMRWSAAPRPEGQGATRWLACGRGFHPGRSWPLDVVRSHAELMAASAASFPA